MKTVTVRHFSTGNSSKLYEGGPAEAYMRFPESLIGFVREGRLIEVSQRHIEGTVGNRFITWNGERIPVNGY